MAFGLAFYGTVNASSSNTDLGLYKALIALCKIAALPWYDEGMKVFTYPITVEREGRAYYAYSDDFPGVYGIGKTIEAAKASILDGMRIYIRECRARRKPVPRARTVYTETISIAL